VRKTLTRLAATAVLVALAVLLFLKLRPNEEKEIRRQIDALAARFSKHAGESSSVMAVKMHSLPDLFADELQLEMLGFPFNGVYRQAEISSHIARARTQFQTIDLMFHDVDVQIQDAENAVATLTGRLIIERANDKAPAEDVREVMCRLRKIDGDWRFTSFEEVEVLAP